MLIKYYIISSLFLILNIQLTPYRLSDYVRLVGLIVSCAMLVNVVQDYEPRGGSKLVEHCQKVSS